MENVFRTRSETANRVYRYFRTRPDNFPILFGFDASGARITSKGILNNIQLLLESLKTVFLFEIFKISTDGSSVDHRWEGLHISQFFLIGAKYFPVVSDFHQAV